MRAPRPHAGVPALGDLRLDRVGQQRAQRKAAMTSTVESVVTSVVTEETSSAAQVTV